MFCDFVEHEVIQLLFNLDVKPLLKLCLAFFEFFIISGFL